jgi:DNA-binding NarL/FixJ family response regulator
VTQQWLVDEGYEVIARQTALGTTAAVLRERPDVLLLDVSMPALRGEHVAELLSRSDGPGGSLVLFYSASPEPELTRLVHASGAHGAIQKTSDRELFLSRFEALAGGKRRHGT